MTRSAIVIPVFNGLPQLADCLASRSWVAGVPDVDAVLVDCGSEDGSRAFVAGEHPWCQSSRRSNVVKPFCRHSTRIAVG